MRTQVAKLNYLRISPRKVRLVADTIRGLSAGEAEARLLTSARRPKESLIKLLRSAVANAKNNAKMDSEKLFVKEVRVDQGPTLKRFIPRAMGRTTPIHKKTSHITLVLGEAETPNVSRFKIAKAEKISKSKARKIMKEKTIKKPEYEEKEVIKAAERPSFMRRIFRRKAV